MISRATKKPRTALRRVAPSPSNLALTLTDAAVVSESAPSFLSGDLLVVEVGNVRKIANRRVQDATASDARIIVSATMVWHFPLLAVCRGPEWSALCSLCEQRTRSVMSSGLHIYKVGITRDPSHRWSNATYGYRGPSEGCTSMTLLACSVPSWAGALETHLITTYSSDYSCRGCQNTAGCGESLPQVPPVFVYVVSVALEDIMAHRLARQRAASSGEYESRVRDAFQGA